MRTFPYKLSLENRHTFSIKRCQVHTIVKKYEKMLALTFTPYPKHSFAIHLVRSGLDPRRVQQSLGYSNLNTTQVYLKFKDEDIR